MPIPHFAQPLTDKEIVEHSQAGTLLSALLHPLNTQNQELLRERLAARHNAGDIDLLALVATPAFQKLEKHSFFTVQQIYNGVLPLLDAEPIEMLTAVQRLVTQAGNDGVATMPWDAMRQWIAQNSERARSVVAVARADPDMDLEVLRDSLVILADMDEVRFFLGVTDARRRAAIAALGAIASHDQQACDSTLSELHAITASDPNDEMRFTAIFAAFMLLRHSRASAPRFLPQLVAAVAARPTDETRAALLQGLWQQSDIFQGTNVQKTLAIVCEGNLSGALLNVLSGTLGHLIGGPHHEIGVICLTNLLGSAGKAMTLDRFASLEHRLMALDRTRLFDIAVRWFLMGDRNLCEAAAKTILGATQKAPPFDDTFAGRSLSGSEMIVICHKAVTFMPLAPVMAASFVVAALRALDKSVESELVQLLFQSILINYGQEVTVYLKSIPKGDPSSRAIKKALKLYSNYEKGLHITPPIKELLPSSYQRGAVRQKHYVTGNEIRKEAERQSILFNLVQRSTLMYGRKSITYVGGADHPPVSIEMKTLSTSFTMPGLEIIDPVGFDWLRRIFQISKTK